MLLSEYYGNTANASASPFGNGRDGDGPDEEFGAVEVDVVFGESAAGGAFAATIPSIGTNYVRAPVPSYPNWSTSGPGMLILESWWIDPDRKPSS